MTVKDLKNFLKTIPDETPIAVYRTNMEGSGYTDKYVSVQLKKMVKQEEVRIDAFDHECYTTEVLYTAGDLDTNTLNVLIIE